MSEQTRVYAGAMLGAVVGAAAAYLFLTEGGRVLRDRIEPAVDDVRREFMRFQKTIEKFGELANAGVRVVNEFNTARMQSPFTNERTSH